MSYVCNYRVLTTGVSKTYGKKFRGVKVSGPTDQRLYLPSFSSMQFINGSPYDYLAFYIGLDYRDGQFVYSIEAGVSMKYSEFIDPSKRGWYPFVKPGVTDPWDNPQSPWRRSTPISDPSSVKLGLIATEFVQGTKPRWKVNFYVNDYFMHSAYTYGNPNDPQCFDVKFNVEASVESYTAAVKFGEAFFNGVYALAYKSGAYEYWDRLTLDDITSITSGYAFQQIPGYSYIIEWVYPYYQVKFSRP